MLPSSQIELETPSRPAAFARQSFTVPSANRAHVYSSQAAISATAVTPGTTTGIVLQGSDEPCASQLSVASKPSSPSKSSPQHSTEPSVRRAHWWSRPTTTWAIEARLEIAVGVGLHGTPEHSRVGGAPSKPPGFEPQQVTVPSISLAQV